MRELIQIVIATVIGLIGIGILLSLAFWAMNNIGFLLIILVILFAIAFFLTKIELPEKNIGVKKELSEEEKRVKKELSEKDIETAILSLIQRNHYKIVDFKDLSYTDVLMYAKEKRKNVQVHPGYLSVVFSFYVDNAEYLVYASMNSYASSYISVEPITRWTGKEMQLRRDEITKGL